VRKFELKKYPKEGYIYSVMFDVLYYSNYCKYSQNVIQHVVKHQLIEKISCISIDKRRRDHQNNHLQIVLENGKVLYLPPNVQSVPALLLTKKNHTVLFGDKQIIQYLKETYGNSAETASPILQFNGGEPSGFAFASATTSGSEKYTNYDMNPEDLLSKSTSKYRDLRNFVSADHNVGTIHAPPETYKPNKISQDITIEDLQKQRETEIPRTI